MKTKENIKLITVGRLLKELKEYSEECPDYEMVCSTPDDRTFGIDGTWRDKDGDLCVLVVDPEDTMAGVVEEAYTVEMLLQDLEECDESTRVYLKGGGLFMNVKPCGDCEIFDEGEDEELWFEVTAFGEYELPAAGSWDHKTEWEKRYIAEEEHKRKLEDRRETIALVALCVLLAGWSVYNVYALISHTGNSIAENIIWIVVCTGLLVIGILTLHFNKSSNKFLCLKSK